MNKPSEITADTVQRTDIEHIVIAPTWRRTRGNWHLECGHV